MNEGQERRSQERVPITRDALINAELWRWRGRSGGGAGAAAGGGKGGGPQSPPQPPPQPPLDAIQVSILNLSPGGLAVCVPTLDPPSSTPELALGDMVGLLLQRGDQRLILQAEVRHQRFGSDACTVGMRFVLDPASASDQALRREIEALLADIQEVAASSPT